MTKGLNLINKQIGKYIILNEISRGGMGVVYLGKHTTINRYAAIKMLFPHLAGESNFVKRFREEMNVLSKLKHPNIVDIYDYEEAYDTYFIIMELVVGRSLESLLSTSGTLRFEEAVGIMRQVLTALDFAHGKNILHRDIKPSNIMITNEGIVKVLDFGIAKVLGSENLTQTGFMVGTPQYISPEQAKGETLQKSSDLYSITVMLFQVLTGRVPFSSENPVGIVMAHIKDPPPKPRKLNPDITSEVEKILLKGLEKDPVKRFQTASEMSEVLDNLLSKTGSKTTSHKEIARKVLLQAEQTSLIQSDEIDPETMDMMRMQAEMASLDGKKSKSNRSKSARSVLMTLRQSVFFKYGLILVSLLIIIGMGYWAGVHRQIAQLFAKSPQPEVPASVPEEQVSSLGSNTTIQVIPADLPKAFGNVLGIEFEIIPAVTFTMGAKAGTSYTLDDKPDHDVYIDTILIAQYEITHEQYNMFIQDTGYSAPVGWMEKRPDPSRMKHPVTGVTWFDAKMFCDWLSKKTGLIFRLPTEAEWERAAYGGGQYPWGDGWPGLYANVSEANVKTTAEAGAYPKDKSIAGVFDMGGNVREWVNDYYSMLQYATGETRNPKGPASGEKRVIRGGAFTLSYTDARITRRDALKPFAQTEDLGFRIVLQPG